MLFIVIQLATECLGRQDIDDFSECFPGKLVGEIPWLIFAPDQLGIYQLRVIAQPVAKIDGLDFLVIKADFLEHVLDRLVTAVAYAKL